ncbi:MAG TPA: F0F1 ATP synthase subunit B [Myxococcales bacterium]|nr:F0F1 ATP synthase subunit B [Myxococcales bacterium]
MPGLIFAAGLMDVEPGLAAWTVVTFVVLLVVLRLVAWKPILHIVEEREKTIAGALDGAKKDRVEAERLLAEQKALLSDSRKEAAEAVRKALADAEVARQEMVQKSRKEAEELLVRARQQIEEDKAKAQAELKGLVVDLAIDVAAKALGDHLADPSRQRALFEQYVEEFPRREKRSA